MRVLFFFRHGGYVRNFESLLVELAERGHSVHASLGASRLRWLGDRRPPIEPLVERYECLTTGAAPSPAYPLQREANGVRGVLDWLRYLRPEYEHAPKLRARVEARVPTPVRRALLAAGAGSPAGNELLHRGLGAVERALPWAPAIDAEIDRHRPDVVCVTPLVDVGTSQPDILRAARRRGIPGVHCVASWDNLTNKGLIRGEPDLITVWNELQREEAVVLHRQPPERVVATGAQSYDHWFSWQPARSRIEFCRQVGLDPERPFFLFLGSSPFVAPDEVPFVRRWLAALRDSPDPRLHEAGVLVRPHPQNGEQWRRADLRELTGVEVWPRGGADPVDGASKADYHDSIHHCAAVVGINTSALIESAIVGRPVLTILDDEFAATQEGTLHFEHLRRAGGGVLYEASSLSDHIEQLKAILERDRALEERNRAFLEVFVRPHGLATPAAPILADAIELAAAMGPRPQPDRPLAERTAALAFNAAVPLRRVLGRGSGRRRKQAEAERGRGGAATVPAAEGREAGSPV
jgi:hypothetical protein